MQGMARRAVVEEGVHESRTDAIRWVEDNTDNKVFTSPLGAGAGGLEAVTIRVDHRGTVLMLRQYFDTKTWYWERMREVI